MAIISNEYAAEIVARMRADIEKRDESVATEPVDVRDLLILKLYDDIQGLTNATAFLGGGIRPVTRTEG